MKATGSMVNFLTKRERDRDRADVAKLVDVGQAHCDAGRYQDAVTAWDAVLAQDPRNAYAANGIAGVLQMYATDQEQLDKAREFAELAINSAQDATMRAYCLDTRATIWMRAQKWIHAIVDLDECLRLAGSFEGPPGQIAVLRLGIAHAAVRNLPLARSNLETAVQVAPDNVEARIWLAQIYDELAEYQLAIQQYQAAAFFVHQNRHLFEDPEWLISHLLNAMGCTSFAASRPDDAEQLQRNAMRVCPRNPYPSANCAIAAGRRGDVAELRRLLNLSISASHPMDAHYVGAMVNEATDLEQGNIILDALLQYGRLSHSLYRRHTDDWARRRDRMQPASPAQPTIQYFLGVQMTESNPNYDNIFITKKSQIGTQNAQNSGNIQSMGGGAADKLSIDLRALAAELADLKAHLLASAGNAEHRGTKEPYCDIQEVESARVAAEGDDRASVLAHLGKAGKWVLDVATKVGAPVAEAALRSALLG